MGLDTLLDAFIGPIKSAFAVTSGKPTGILHELFRYLATLELAFLGLSMAFGKSQSLNAIIEKIITLCFIWWIMQNFFQLTTYMKEYLVAAIAQFFGHDPRYYDAFIFTPDAVMSISYKQVVEPLSVLVKAVQEGSSALDWTRIFNPAILLELITLTLTVFLVELCFLLIALQLFLGYIEFYIILVLAYILFPFVVFEPTRFLGERALPAVFGQLVKIAVLITTTFLVVNAMLATMPTKFLTALMTEYQNPSIQQMLGPPKPDLAAVVKRFYPTITSLDQVSIGTILTQVSLLSIAGAATSIFAPGMAASFLGGMPSFNLMSTASALMSMAALGRSRQSNTTANARTQNGGGATSGPQQQSMGAAKTELAHDRGSGGGEQKWVSAQGGSQGLSDTQRLEAETAYQQWSEKKPELASRYNFDDYVSYVQTQEANKV